MIDRKGTTQAMVKSHNEKQIKRMRLGETIWERTEESGFKYVCSDFGYTKFEEDINLIKMGAPPIKTDCPLPGCEDGCVQINKKPDFDIQPPYQPGHRHTSPDNARIAESLYELIQWAKETDKLINKQ